MTAAQKKSLLSKFTWEGDFVCVQKGRINAYVQANPRVRARLQTLNRQLMPYDFHFGYRVFDEIISFLASAEDNGLFQDFDGRHSALDAAILMKVLPKFHGARGKLEAPLKEILSWCLNPDAPDPIQINQVLNQVDNDTLLHELESLRFVFPNTAQRVSRLLWSLYTTGFAAFG